MGNSDYYINEIELLSRNWMYNQRISSECVFKCNTVIYW